MKNKQMTTGIDELAEQYRKAEAAVGRRVIVCAGTGCVANGSLEVANAFKREIAETDLNVTTSLDTEDNCGEADVHLSESGCQGFCQMGPLVTILPDNILYTQVKEDDVHEIVKSTLQNNETIDRLLYVEPGKEDVCKGVDEVPFYTRQSRTILADCGTIDPRSLPEYLANGGYQAACKAFTEMTPEDVCREVEDSGLRGRGGGGFPTGRKWDLTRIQGKTPKYVICNGDEGDPGAFMDRSLMEGNPHAVLEGMMIAGRAVGATEGYVYVRLEYPLAVERIRQAVADAEAQNILGSNVFGSGYAFRIQIMEGAGAFVCGEETALMASIEGKRGMPNPKPPFPAQSGLGDCPTVINNVETLATVPLIIKDGAEAFKKVGTPDSPGTKTFALTGHVANTGLIEVPFGVPLSTVVEEIGGGVTDDDDELTGESFKAVQIGGPSGGCLTQDQRDLPLDFDSLKSVGAMIGSGGLVVMNQHTCMVSVARFFMQFTQNESCGKCVPCREGTRQMLSLLDDIIEARATAETIPTLERVARTVQKASLCGLGKTAPSPVLSTLESFRDEYEAHVHHQRCPAGRCKALTVPEIDAEACIGCTACVRKCPVDAISGEPKQPHQIDPELCIRCGACVEACKFNAIKGV